MQYPQYPGYGQPPPAGYPGAAQPPYSGYPQQYPPPTYSQSAYPQPGYDQPAYPQSGYPQTGYPQQPYPYPAYPGSPQPAYPAPPQPGAPQPGYPATQPAYPASPQPAYPASPQPSYAAMPQPYVMPEISWGTVHTTDTSYREFGMEYNPYDYGSWGRQEYFEPAKPAPVYNFTPQQFQKLRNHNTKESALKQLKEIGCDASTTPVKLFTQPITRVCFICANTYTTPTRQLGVGPLNDAITVGANHRLMGYFVYYLHNPKSKVFMEYLKMFLRLTSENLTVYYTGHGSQVRDRSGDEADGFDEAMVFEDTYVLDDDLAEAVKKNANGRCRVLLLNDCCRSGTIWDIPEDIRKAERSFPPNIMSFSGSRDSQTSKQVSGLGNIGSAQGLFTFHFFQHVRKNRMITPNQIRPLLNRDLQRYSQTVEIYPTRRQMFDEPIFPQ